MKPDSDKPRDISDPGLELTMRDIVGNLEDLALRAGYAASLEGMEVLEVIPADAYDAGASPPEDDADNVVMLTPAARYRTQG